MLQGVIIGIIGTTVGTIAGVVAATVADRYKLDLGGRRTSTRCPTCRSRCRPIDLVMVVVRGDADLLRRDDLSLAPGRPPRSGAGAAI